MFHKTGSLALNVKNRSLDFFTLVGDISLAIPHCIAHPWRSLHFIAYEIYRCGHKSLLTVCLISFLFGTVIVAIGGAQFRNFGSEIYVANLIGIALARELATLITSICLLFLAAARFTDETARLPYVDKPFYALCFSRVIALAITTPILSLCAFYAALIGGAIIADHQFNINSHQFWNQITVSVPVFAIGLGLFKAFLFGIEIALVGCFYGTICQRKEKPLGESIIASITVGFFVIAVTDSIIELLLYYLT